jgi:hypothetical protein
VTGVRLRGDVSGAEKVTSGTVSSHSLFLSSSFYLEMSMKIENTACCEIRSVIKFLNAKNVCPAEIYRQVCKDYGHNAMSDGMVRR